MSNASSLNSSGSLPLGIWLVLPLEVVAITVVIVCIIFLYFYHKALREKIEAALSKIAGKTEARTEETISTTDGREMTDIPSMSECYEEDYQVSDQRTHSPLNMSQEETDNTKSKSQDKVGSQVVQTEPTNEDPHRTLNCSYVE